MDTDIVRSHAVTNSFYFLYSSGKAALFPFLPLFFRLLGLTATQTGIAIGVYAFCTVLCAPLWMACAKRWKRKHLILTMSIFSLMTSFLVLSLIPPTKGVYNPIFCLGKDNTDQKVTSNNSTANQFSTSAATKISTSSSSTSISFSVTTLPTTTLSLWDMLDPDVRKTMISHGYSEDDVNQIPPDKWAKLNLTFNVPPTETTAPGKIPTSTSSPGKLNLTQYLSPESLEILYELGIKPSEIQAMTKEEIFQIMELINQTEKELLEEENKDEKRGQLDPDLENLLSKYGLTADTASMDEDEIRSLLEIYQQGAISLEEVKEQLNPSNHRTTSRKRSFSSKINRLQEAIEHYSSLTFVYVLSVLIIGAIFSSPLEKLADKMWFDFLDALDLVERYETYRLWCVLAYLLVPLAVTTVIAYTPCGLGLQIHRFHLHFYSFAGFIGISFVVAFFLPYIQDIRKPPRPYQFCKGLRILCGDCPAVVYTITVCLLGFLTAGIDNFMFWKVQDLGGSELVLGGAIAVGAFTDIILLFTIRSFISKISIAGAVLLGFLSLGLQLVAFSFMWLAWLVIIISLFQCFRYRLIWGAVEQYPDFKVNPILMDRSALSVLQSMYLGVGYALGSVVSGFLYDYIGIDFMYQGGAGICLLWSFVFALFVKLCKPKEKIWYSKLLAEDENELGASDEADSEEDDWLKNAITNHK